MVKMNDIFKGMTQQTAADTNNITLTMEKVPEGKILEVTLISVKDETSAAKTLRIGFKIGGDIQWLREEPAATNTHSIVETGTIYLLPNECIVGMVESPTAADVCKLYVIGKYVE